MALAEHYKTIHLLEKNSLLKEIIGRIQTNIQGTAILFGSYSKGLANEESDIDLFIIGTYEEEIKKTQQLFNKEINIKTYPKKEFEKLIKTDILLKEIHKNHHLVKGADYYIEQVLKK